MLLSIIIPTKNEQHNISNLLNSIINSNSYTPKNIEIIVVDNPTTTDNTSVIVGKYNNVKLFSKGPERSAQRNYGAKQATGEYLYFVDADMEFTPDLLYDILRHLNFKYSITIPERVPGSNIYAKALNLEKMIYDKNNTISASRIFSKKSFKETGGYNEEMVCGKDWDLDRRIKALGITSIHLTNHIIHNEKDLGFVGNIKKKLYYAAKIQNMNIGIESRVNPFYRYFVLFSKPGLILANILPFLYLITLKTTQFASGFWTVVTRAKDSNEEEPQITNQLNQPQPMIKEFNTKQEDLTLKTKPPLFNLILNWIYNNAWILLAILVSMITFHNWISFNIFTKADWGYYFGNTLGDFLNYNIWNPKLNLGGPDVTIWRYPYFVAIGLLSKLGLSYQIIEKILVFWPIIVLTPLAGYNLGRTFKFDKFPSFISALVFSFNTYFLAIITQGHLLLNLGFAIATFSFTTFITAIRRNSIKHFMLSSAIAAVAGHTDLRCLYILMIVLFLYVLSNFSSSIKAIKGIAVYGVNIVLLNLFWLIPVILNGSRIGSSALDRNLFGNQFWSLSYATALHHPFWTGGNIEWFTLTNIPLYYWVLPIMALCGIVFSFYSKKKNIGFFLIGLCLVGIMLTKQVDNPFGLVYVWLFDNFPGFKAFREASKFYYLIILGYSLAIGLFIHILIKSQKGLTRTVSLVLSVTAIVGLTLVNITPYVIDSLDGLTKVKNVPSEYVTLNEKFKNEDNSYFRTLWVPKDSRWAWSSNNQPRLSLADLFPQNLAQINTTNATEDFNLNKVETFTNYINQPYFQDLIKNLSVKYIIVPLEDNDNTDNFFKFFGNNRDAFLNALDKLSYLKKDPISTSKVSVYAMNNFKPEIVGNNGTIVSINNTSNLGNKYNFIKNTLNYNNPSIIYNKDESNLNKNYNLKSINQIEDPYEGLTPDNLDLVNNKIMTPVLSNDYQNLYIDRVQYRLLANLKGDSLKLELVPSNNNFTKLDSTITSPNILVSQSKIDPNLDTFVNYKNTNIQINPGLNTLGTYDYSSEVKIYSRDTENKVGVGKFEGELWHPTVRDCNEYDKFGDIGLKRISNGFNDSSSVQLTATKHTACLQKVIEVTPDTNYIIKGKFQVLEPKDNFASFNLSYLDTFKDRNPSTLVNTKDKLIANDNNWTSFTKFFNNPSENKNLEISLYAEETGSTNTVNYDEIEVYRVNKVESVTLPDIKPDFKKYSTTQFTKDKLEYNSFIPIKNNLINGDFENGLWQKEVGDCSKFDNDAKIEMKLSNDKSNYLELSSASHLACTSTNFNFDSKSDQLLLNYKYYTESDNAGYYIQFNDLNNKLIKIQKIIPEAKINKWNEVSEIVNIPQGATRGVIGVYAYPGLAGKAVTKYDDIKLFNIPKIEGTVYATNAENQVLTSDISLLDNNNSQVSNKPFAVPDKSDIKTITLNSNYNQDWSMTQVDNKSHFKTIFNTNVWAVDKDSNLNNYKTFISYQPQQQFQFVLPIAFLVMISSLFITLYLFTKREIKK